MIFWPRNSIFSTAVSKGFLHFILNFRICKRKTAVSSLLSTSTKDHLFQINKSIFQLKAALGTFSISINVLDARLKGTLIQIEKSPYMFAFIQKQYPEKILHS